MQYTSRFYSLLLLGLLLCLPTLQSTASVPRPTPQNSSATPDSIVLSALNTFQRLSPKEKRNKIREIKNRLQNWKKQSHPSAKDAPDDTVLLALLAVFLPPLAVFLKEEEINARFWISLLLTLLFWLPGIVYALLVVFEVI